MGAREVLWVKADKEPQGVRNKFKQLRPEAKKGERKKQQAKEASSELRSGGEKSESSGRCFRGCTAPHPNETFGT